MNCEQEIWKTIPDTSDRYEISTHGRIRNRETGHILAQREHIPRDKDPYMRCDLFPPGPGNKSERKISLYVHRLVVAVFLYEALQLPDGIQAHHKDRNRKNNRLSNLDGLTIPEHSAEHSDSETALTEAF